MRLVPDLDAHFIRREVRTEPNPGVYLITVEKLEDADGVMYLCPLCFKNNGGPVGTHRVLNWFVGRVPKDADPKPGRWIPHGTGLHDLTFVGPSSTSVLLAGGCNWHGFVRNGDAT